MDNLLFYSLLIAIAYYFMVYAKPTTRPDPSTEPKLTHSRSTQTEPKSTEYEPGPEDTLNCPGAIKFPSAQFVPDPDTIKNLEDEVSAKQAQISALAQDQKSKEKTIQGLN